MNEILVNDIKQTCGYFHDPNPQDFVKLAQLWAAWTLIENIGNASETISSETQSKIQALIEDCQPENKDSWHEIKSHSAYVRAFPMDIAHTFKRLAANLAYLGYFSKASKIADYLGEKREHSDAYYAIACTLATSEKIDEAIATLLKLGDESSGRLFSLAAHIEKQGNLANALTVAQAIANTATKDNALQNLAIKFAVKEKFDKAIEIAQLIKDRDDYDYTIGQIIIAAAEKGNVELGFELLQSIKRKYSYAPVRFAIASELLKRGQLDQAQTLIDDALTKIIPDYHYFYMADIFARNNQAEQVMFAFNALKPPQIHARTNFEVLAELAPAMVQVGKFDELEKYILSIELPKKRTEARLYFAAELLEAEELDYALKLFRKVRNRTRTNWIKQTLAAALKYQGRFAEAVTIFKTIDDPLIQGETLEQMAYHIKDEEEAQQLIQLAESIEKFEAKDHVLRTIAVTLAQNGDIEKALEIAFNRKHYPRNLETFFWNIAKYSAQHYYYAAAFSALGLRNLPEFLSALTDWSLEKEVFLKTMQSICQIFGWHYPEYAEIAKLLTEE